MTIQKFDIIIVGAGPAGCACAYQLANKGLSVAILDKDYFPRDKICGDALSADVINQLYRMSPDLVEKFNFFEQKEPSEGIRFFAPNLKHVDIPYQPSAYAKAPGFISKRKEFDAFFFNEIKNQKDIHVFENQKVIDIISSDNEVKITTENNVFSCEMIIGADGANSIVNKKLTNHQLEKEHFAAGLRQYYEGVTGYHDNNHIELHFYKDILPGYFWIFPLPNNQANIGLGIMANAVLDKNINIKERLQDIIKNNPNIKDRFKNAKPLETVKGFRLPMGSKKRAISGDRFLLLGDAASLIDPFSGEGIGNAIRSGRFAAEHLIKAFEKQCFNAKFNKQYDKIIYQKMWKEFQISRSIAKMLNYPRLFDMVINKTQKSESFRLLLTSMLDNVDIKKELVKPSFYFKLLFN